MTQDYATRYRHARDGLRYFADERDFTQLLGVAQLDQMDAAARDVQAAVARIQTLHPQEFPDPATVAFATRHVRLDVAARIIAAMGDGSRWRTCHHIHDQSTQPAVIMLPARRVTCRSCMQQARREPPPQEADRCDMCGSRGNATFWPIALALGPALVIGDVCKECSDSLTSVLRNSS